jgi:release factor glutamine methyltransferase
VTFHEAAGRGRSVLIDAGLQPSTATLDADLLARHALGWDLATWLTHRSQIATPLFIDTYESLIARRARREPVAYIRGVQEFWGREFLVNGSVLIPRPETELVIELAFQCLAAHSRPVVVDVGTGSGCIAVTLAMEQPRATVFATDISEAALAVARLNAERLGARDRVAFVHGSLLGAARGPFDLIVSNPPYVAERDRAGLSREVRDYEPAVALFGGEDGWRDIRALLREAAEALTPAGVMLMELGYGQSEQLAQEIARVPSLRLDGIAPDLQGIPRLARIRRANS